MRQKKKLKSIVKSTEETIHSTFSKLNLTKNRSKSSDSQRPNLEVNNNAKKKNAGNKSIIKSPISVASKQTSSIYATTAKPSKASEPSQVHTVSRLNIVAPPPESQPSTKCGKSKKAGAKKKKKLSKDSGSLRKFNELRKKNNQKEDELLRRLAAIQDDDCKLPELKQTISLFHHSIKRLGYGVLDQTDCFTGCLTKSSEYLSIIQQYRRMQAHKMAILLDRLDEECKKSNQLMEEHFEEINCVYQLMKPDATPKELMDAVCKHWIRKIRTFFRWVFAEKFSWKI